MAADKSEIIRITPNISQLLTTHERVSCTEEGCTKTFIHAGALHMHVVKVHGLIKNDKDKCLFHGRKVDTVSAFHCPVELCQYHINFKRKHFSSFTNLKQHYLKVHAERDKHCDQCGMGFSTERLLEQHKGRCGVLYTCGTCSVKYTTKEALLTHCKRQDHVYPKEYSFKEKEKKNVKQKPPPQPMVTIVTQPVLLIPTPVKEVHKPKPVRTILCKPPAPVTTAHQLVSQLGVVDPKVVNFKGADSTNCMSQRQDALIQTDIYGVNTLALSSQQGNQQQMNNTVTNTQKKSSCLKRRISFQGDQNASSPRRKKVKSSTGMQTAVSLTKKKGVPMVSSTQTTGDYIIETALRQANIHIEKKTVALQVTPQKSYKKGKAKPVLVDSYSQVKQQNIYAETSHNLAESQTMTDIPPSISTQTLQSYLVNQQELHNKNQTTYNKRVEDVQKQQLDTNQTDENNTLRIYDESLHTPVEYVMPESVGSEKLQNYNSTLPHGNYYIQSVTGGSENTAQKVELRTLDRIPHNVHSHSNIGPSIPENNYLMQAHHTMDMEAQTMSATEFDILLESSGIFLNKTEFLTSTENRGHKQSVSMGTQSSINESHKFTNNLEFLNSATSTMDMNTQTSDLNLFEGLVPIDSNTQTGGEGFDFLDMVMTNMETQTLNDDDLVSLGLLDTSLNASTMSHQNTGYSSQTGSQVYHDQIKQNVPVTSYHGNQSKMTSTSTSTDVFTDLNLLGLDNNVGYDTVNHASSTGSNSSISKPEQMGTSHKGHVIETQTMSLDFTEPLIQTETQTQVESTDTDFEMMNMETQTTFDDLQQLSDWVH